MATAQEPKDFFSQLGDFQKNWYAQWTDAYNKIYQPWLDSAKYWQGMKTPFLPPDLLAKWNEMTQETIGKAADQAEQGFGPKVFARFMSANNVFLTLNEFWMEALKDLPELNRVKGDAVKSREIFDRWVDRYKRILEQLIGAPISNTAEELMTSWLNTVQMHQASMGLLWNPWIAAMPEWKKQAEKLMKGDWSALSEGRSLWREVYDETLGRVFRMPAFGLTKEHTEKVRRAYDAFIQYASSQPHLYQYFYDTGMAALKEVFEKIQNLKFEEATPEAMREIYKIWLTTNENAFFELFKRQDFSNAMGEALNYGLRLKKRLDDLTADWCEALSIPSNREFDAMAKAVHDLRRKVHQQQKTIDALQQKLESK